MTAEPAPLTDKQLAARVLAQMPESVTLEQISEELAILAALRKGERAAAEGRVVPHEEVKQRGSIFAILPQERTTIRSCS